jgi:hypothetical protein
MRGRIASNDFASYAYRVSFQALDPDSVRVVCCPVLVPGTNNHERLEPVDLALF